MRKGHPTKERPRRGPTCFHVAGRGPRGGPEGATGWGCEGRGGGGGRLARSQGRPSPPCPFTSQHAASTLQGVHPGQSQQPGCQPTAGKLSVTRTVAIQVHREHGEGARVRKRRQDAASEHGHLTAVVHKERHGAVHLAGRQQVDVTWQRSSEGGKASGIRKVRGKKGKGKGGTREERGGGGRGGKEPGQQGSPKWARAEKEGLAGRRITVLVQVHGYKRVRAGGAVGHDPLGEVGQHGAVAFVPRNSVVLPAGGRKVKVTCYMGYTTGSSAIDCALRRSPPAPSTANSIDDMTTAGRRRGSGAMEGERASKHVPLAPHPRASQKREPSSP